MIEVASCVGTVKYIRRGISAISYEVALDTNSVTADGKTGKFLTTKLGKYHFLKHTGNKTEDCTDVLETFNFLVLPIDKNGTVLINGRISGGASGDIYDPFFDESIKEEDVSQIKFFWYSAPVAEAGNFNYIKALTHSQGVPTKNMPFTILASNTFLVVRQGADGPQGPPGAAGSRGSSGPVWRQHVGFVSATADAPYQYYTGSNDERFIDVVLIDKVWYRCLQSYKSTGTADARNTPTNAEFAKYWTSADMSNFTFIATQFLLAENAKINLFGSNEINLYSSDAEGKIFASFRVPNGNGDDSLYALWIGAETGAKAPYSVTKEGHMKGTDVDLSGKINAMSGSIGNFSIVNGSIKYTSAVKTCEVCTDYVQYVDLSGNQSLYFGYGDSGIKAKLSGKDEDGNDMSCQLVVAHDDLNRKNIGLVAEMSGFHSKLAPNELYIGDLFKRAFMVRIFGNKSTLQRYYFPDVGVGCYIASESREMTLVLKGLRSGNVGSVWHKGEIYEENGFLKIHK